MAMDREKMREAATLLLGAYNILLDLGVAEEHHGYGSVGGALVKMTDKVREVASEARLMAADPYVGAQRVRGR